MKPFWSSQSCVLYVKSSHCYLLRESTFLRKSCGVLGQILHLRLFLRFKLSPCSSQIIYRWFDNLTALCKVTLWLNLLRRATCVLCLTPVPVQCSRNLNVLGLFTNWPFSSPWPGLKTVFFFLRWEVRNYGMVKASVSQTESKTFPILSVFL